MTMMQGTWRVGLMAVGVWLAGMGIAVAGGQPIGQLPVDVARWSTFWIAVPNEMADVGQEYGPLAALTWGPIKGTAHMVQSVAKELWGVAKMDWTRGTQANRGRPNNALLRYEF